MWELHNQRPLPPSTVLDGVEHLCCNPACVNPWHLSFSTQRQNIKTSLLADRPNVCRRKLSNEDVREIRLLREQGEYMNELAAQFRVHKSTIQRILSKTKNRGHTYLS
jgi:ActR/RegA family two-component response regulator